MSTKMKDLLLTLLAALMLVCFAALIPSPTIGPEASERYWESAGDVDDDYAFLFDE